MITSRFTKSIAGTVLAAGTLGFAAIVGAGTANADAVDDTYLASLAQAGIPQIAPDRAILAGHAVCQNLDEGATPAQLIASFVAQKVFATRQQDEAMIIASMTAYCPHHLPALHS
jgi:hypothetical protein